MPKHLNDCVEKQDLDWKITWQEVVCLDEFALAPKAAVTAKAILLEYLAQYLSVS